MHDQLCPSVLVKNDIFGRYFLKQKILKASRRTRSILNFKNHFFKMNVLRLNIFV